MLFPAAHRLTDWFRKLPLQGKILLIGFVALLIFCLPWFYDQMVWLYKRNVCIRNGGEWTAGGMAARPFCLYTYPDRGKPCNSSEQCIGPCVVYEVPIQGQPTPSIGVCKDNNDPFECYATIEHPDIFGCAD